MLPFSFSNSLCNTLCQYICSLWCSVHMNIHCVNKAVLTIQKVGLNTCQQLHVGGCTTPHTEFYSLSFSGYERVYILYICIAIQIRGETALKGACLLRNVSNPYFTATNTHTHCSDQLAWSHDSWSSVLTILHTHELHKPCPPILGCWMAWLDNCWIKRNPQLVIFMCTYTCTMLARSHMATFKTLQKVQTYHLWKGRGVKLSNPAPPQDSFKACSNKLLWGNPGPFPPPPPV